MRLRHALRRMARDLGRERRGAVALEAALIGSLLLVPLAVGAADLGSIFTTQARLDTALEAAALYAWGNPGNATPANITQIAQSAYGTAAPTLVVTTPQNVCYCISVGGGQQTRTAVSCTGSCASGAQLGIYLSVSFSTNLSLPAPVPGLPTTVSLSSAGMVRTQ